MNNITSPRKKDQFNSEIIDLAQSTNSTLSHESNNNPVESESSVCDVNSCSYASHTSKTNGFHNELKSSTDSRKAAPETYRLELIFGAMMGGKSSELIRRLKVKSLYKKILAVNTKKDNRYGDEGIITHDNRVMQAIRVSNLNELLVMSEYVEADVIGIDEGNFFPEIYDFIVNQLETTGKTFIIAALNGDKDKNPFGTINKLLGHAEKIDFYPALCKRCGDGTQASFSAALEQFEGQEKVGGSTTYEAVCRRHYDIITLNQKKSITVEIRTPTYENHNGDLKTYTGC